MIEPGDAAAGGAATGGAADAPAPAGKAGLDPNRDWEAPVRRDGAPNVAPVLSVEGFEGPLDWLLDLARRRRIDLAMLSIVALVDAFVAAMETALAGADARAGARPDSLARWSHWLVMAADLVLLRSRLLAPADAAAAQHARTEAEALRQALAGRAEMAAAAEWLERQPQLGRQVFARGRPDPAALGRTGQRGDVTGLLRACLLAIRLPPDAAERYQVPGPPFWSVADAVARIGQGLPALGVDGGELALFLPTVPVKAPQREQRCRAAVAATLLGALELARNGTVVLDQSEAWQPIHLASPPAGSGSQA